jgi:hypothetical protein
MVLCMIHPQSCWRHDRPSGDEIGEKPLNGPYPIASRGMAHPSYPQPAKPPIATTDLTISIGAIVLTVVLGVVAAAMGLFSLAFLDYCPPASCSAQGAATAVGMALLAAFAIGVVGLVVTVIRLNRRKPGWPFAVATFVLCGLAAVLGGVGYAMAVGA